VRALLAATALAAATALVATPMASAMPDATDENDTLFLERLAAKGFTPTDEDEWILAGYNVCWQLDEGDGLIAAAAWVMDVHELTGKQATAVADAAVAVYCPSDSPSYTGPPKKVG